ncbi:TolC family protein [Clostridium sp. C2-6-12]|uniref:TolC family protein n=1 Tax=Clostridium sp. C2-6-12 TaxID=2698832 RepID=UPI0013695FCD|nr:TolC family protein [Clostridium sp. C2-6-12]
MKRAFVSLLIMTLTLTNISLVNITSVQAATADNIVTTDKSATTDDDTLIVSLENIREIVIENNISLKIADNNLKIAKEKRDDAKESFDSKSKPSKSDYTDANTGVVDTSAYNSALSNYNTAKSNYESAKENLTKAKDNYDKNVETVVYSAQQAYISYLNDMATKKISEATQKYNEKKSDIYKIQYENGFISKNQYLSKIQGDTSVNDLNKSKDTEELNRIKLCNTLGLNPNDKIVFNTDVTVDFNVISHINYEKDLAVMLDNNQNIKDKKDAIDNLDDQEDTYDNNDQEDIYDYEQDNAKMDLNQTENTAETDFKALYNDLMSSYNSLKNSYEKIMQEQKTFEITQAQYDYGYMSKNALENSQITLDKDNASFIKTRNECYLKYLKYTQMKEGY